MMKFLRSRVRYPAYRFTFSNTHSVAFSYLTGCIPKPINLEGFSFLRNEETYGTLTHWTNENNLKSLVEIGLIPACGYGLAGLLSHDDDMSFLTSFVTEMLNDISMTSMFVKNPEMREEPVPEFNESETSLRLLSIRSLYRVPQDLDFKRHVSLIEPDSPSAKATSSR